MENNTKKSYGAVMSALIVIAGSAVAYASGIFGGSSNTPQTPNQNNNPTDNKNVAVTNTQQKRNYEDDGQEQDDENYTTVKNTNPNPTPTPTPIPAPAGKYKNGTFSTTGSYNSPGGQDQFGLSITIKNNIVSSATFTPMAMSGSSSRYQMMFNQGFQSQVVGKNIDQVSVGVVNGASLTSMAFMNALQKIKSQAL